MRPRIAAAALVAACALSGPATAASVPQEQSRDTLVEAVECHAFTEARLRDTAKRLEGELRWTYAHETLQAETLLHERVGRFIALAADRAFQRKLLHAYFPEGVTGGDS
jgi:hypothetical protein